MIFWTFAMKYSEAEKLKYGKEIYGNAHDIREYEESYEYNY